LFGPRADYGGNNPGPTEKVIGRIEAGTKAEPNPIKRY